VKLKTYVPKKEDVQGKWYLFDANGMILGRLASRIAAILRGKNRPQFTPHLDLGDHVIVINASKVRLSGKKAGIKTYFHHTGHPGGLREERFVDLLRRKPEEVIQRAVKGMLPHNRLGGKQILKLKVYAGNTHPHTAQNPEVVA